MTANITHLRVYGLWDLKSNSSILSYIIFYSQFTFPQCDLSFILVLLSHSLKVIEDLVCCLLCVSTGCSDTPGTGCLLTELFIIIIIINN
jgi:hypothetical protein